MAEQGSSWKVSIAEAVAKVLFAVGYFYIYRKKDPLEKQSFADSIGDASTGMLSGIL